MAIGRFGKIQSAGGGGDPRRRRETRMTAAPPGGSMLPGFRAMARYNRWMNERIYGHYENLSDAERRADRGAFFRRAALLQPPDAPPRPGDDPPHAGEGRP